MPKGTAKKLRKEQEEEEEEKEEDKEKEEEEKEKKKNSSSGSKMEQSIRKISEHPKSHSSCTSLHEKA